MSEPSDRRRAPGELIADSGPNSGHSAEPALRDELPGVIDADTPEPVEEVQQSRVLTYKQLAKEKRKAMYQQAKAQRATDPRHLAQKEAAQKFRREAYQRAKERLKQTAATAKAQAKAAENAERDARYRERTEAKNRELMKLITWVVKRSDAEND